MFTLDERWTTQQYALLTPIIMKINNESTFDCQSYIG